MNIKELKILVIKAMLETDRRFTESTQHDVKLANMAKYQAYKKVYDAINNKPDGLKCDI